MTDPIERINNANTIKELVDLIKGEAEFFSKDKHDWYECMFGDMAVLYNALAERLSVLDKQKHVDQGCDWRFQTAMTEIYAIAFRPENSRPEYAAETIDAIERIAGKALCVGEVHEPKPKNCDIDNTKVGNAAAMREALRYIVNQIDKNPDRLSAGQLLCIIGDKAEAALFAPAAERKGEGNAE